MPKNKEILSLAVIDRMFKVKGANRVSKKALIVVQEYITNKAMLIVKRAMDVATNSNRKTILQRDINLAESKFFKND